MRRSLLPLLVLAACAAVPTVAAATSNSVLVAGPLKVRSYRMYMLATPAARHASAFVDVFFERGKSNDLQEHFYGFGHGVSVKIARDGSSASVQANLGSWGHVHMNLSRGADVLTLPAGCNGSLVVQHKGPLAGANGFGSRRTPRTSARYARAACRHSSRR